MSELGNYIMVFDIETIPDITAGHNLTGCPIDDKNEARKALVDYHLRITDGKNSFLRQLFHQIVTISYAKIAIKKTSGSMQFNLESIKSACNEDATEKELISWFFQLIDQYCPKLVSFNGRIFDIPVIKYRAMIHGISGNTFYHHGDKWNNYNQRYNTDYHFDLMDRLSDFGASASVKLNEVCAAFGYPGKIGVDGEDVASLYDMNRIDLIRNYCETDVLNTYLIYLRYALHTAILTKKDYQFAIQQVAHYLLNSDCHHFKTFYDAWLLTSKYSIDSEILLTQTIDNNVS